MADPVLLLGARRGALRALRERGLDVSRTAPDPGRFGAAGEGALLLAPEPEDADRATDSILRWLGGVRPRAVLAGGERWVELAARVREELRLPGLAPAEAARSTDKVAMKRAFQAADLPCARWREIEADASVQDLVRDLGLPIVLERARSSGSRELEIVHGIEDLRRRFPNTNWRKAGSRGSG